MSFLSESNLKSYRNSVKLSNKTLNESLREFKAETRYLKTTIFLSHKHDELENLEGAISFLKNHSANVYVDWLDEGMPKTTSGQTADRIKEKIKQSDKFILLAPEGAINSKWCNWELGLGDADKYIDNIALLPVEKDDSYFKESEYLQIYPYVDYENGNNKYSNGTPIPKGYYVRTRSFGGRHTIIPLKDWLR